MTTRKPSAAPVASSSQKSKVSAASAPKKPIKARGRNNIKVKENKAKEKTSTAPAVSWVWHGILDVSMECRPVLRPLAKGERHMDFMVQAHHAHMPQGGPSQVTLRLRAQINVADGPLALAEIHYSGIAETQLSAEELQKYHVALYPLARAAMLEVMAHSGHTPPIPEHIEDMKQEDTAQ